MRKIFSLLTIFLAISTTLSFADESQNEAAYGNGASFARVSVVEGTINIKRDAEFIEKIDRNFVVESMDVLETEYASRTVIQFIDGSLLKLGENTKIDFLKIAGEDTSFSFLVRVWKGKVYADISEDDTFKEREFRIDTATSTIFLLSSGRYRVDILNYGTKAKTISGLAEVSINQGSKLVHAGEVAVINNNSKIIAVNNFNTFSMDNFEAWASSRNNRQLAESSQYVPKEIKHYVSDLDSSGSWYYDTEVSTYVWRPISISLNWTPYSNGYWSYSPYGSTWVSYYSWGYAPFHYGSWYFSGSLGWCWSPGYYYSPAWVSWSCWNNNVGWYPYNYHYHNYTRGRVVRHGVRSEMVYINSSNLYNRHIKIATGRVPKGTKVVRTVRPIAPHPSQMAIKPIRAISSSIAQPVRVKTIRNAQIKSIQTNSHSTSVRNLSPVKPIRSNSTGSVKPIRINSNNSVKPNSTGRTIKTGSVKPIRINSTKSSTRTITPRKTTTSGSSSRVITPRKSTNSNNNSKSIRIKSPTIKSRYVQPRTTHSTTRTSVIRNTTNRNSSFSRPVSTPSSSYSGHSRTVRTPNRSSSSNATKTYTKPKSSSSSSSKNYKSYSTPSKSSSKSYSKPVRTYTPSRSHTTSRSSSTSSSHSNSSGRSVRRR